MDIETLKEKYGVPDGYWAAEELVFWPYVDKRLDGHWDWAGDGPMSDARALTVRISLCVSEYPVRALAVCGYRKCINPQHMRFTSATCSYGECEGTASVDGLCGRHLGERRRVSRGVEMTCAFDGCSRQSKVAGLCRSHRTQHLQGKDLYPVRAYRRTHVG